MDNFQISIKETDFTTEDGRWEDDEWVNYQAEISACENLIEKGLK